MNSAAYVSIILGCCVLWVACSFPVALSCDSCGRECASACGTRHFRTCCFNYLRKRSSSPPLDSSGIDKRLEQLYRTRPAEQKPPAMVSSLNNILSNTGEGSVDYEYLPILSSNHLTFGRTDTPARTNLLSNTPASSRELYDKSSEEGRTGSLQFFYET
uniref:Trissin n=1 Tax=Anopheles epiroticus TaxID=199890 RepID=A0A182PYU6_9DIPT